MSLNAAQRHAVNDVFGLVKHSVSVQRRFHGEARAAQASQCHTIW
jgi:hypothetical protein